MNNAKNILKRHIPDRPFEVHGNVITVSVEAGELLHSMRGLMRAQLPLVMMFATDEREKRNAFRIHYVFGVPNEQTHIVLVLDVVGTEIFPSVAREFPSCALYEREIMTLFGLTAEDHPDPRTVLLHEENWPKGMYPLRKDFAWNTRVPETQSGRYRFTTVEGEGIYEIPVGPVHAGIIEPGHFRFSVAGEEIIALEARLGWVHKGVEKLFESLPLEKQIQLAERVSGDSSFAHSVAFCEAVEELASLDVPARAQYLRLIFAELERIIMHTFDVANIAGNGTGFSFMSSQGFRMVEELRRLAEAIGGNRFLRGINILGGVSKDLHQKDIETLGKFLTAFEKEFNEIIAIADGSASLMNRLKGTGFLPRQVALDYGAVGIAARCCDIGRDVRINNPYSAYKKIAPALVLEKEGDVHARFRVRVREIFESVTLIRKALSQIPSGPISTTTKADFKDDIAVRSVEGWRGEIAYAVIVEGGNITRVKLRDASFINWQLFPHVISGDMVPDFPLTNKSFNLSYTGNDM